MLSSIQSFFFFFSSQHLQVMMELLQSTPKATHKQLQVLQDVLSACFFTLPLQSNELRGVDSTRIGSGRTCLQLKVLSKLRISCKNIGFPHALQVIKARTNSYGFLTLSFSKFIS
ncbi:hypothetical protein OIU84_015233 [Salix udensis]|uniref:Uncharacterized protein n=1 Tax=Salix udensis TaxID=889485 RepID=A0AAD6JDQ3_9ROSI|nr:hypothetical protein OIU84_015233 [Salix udensis]